MEQSPPESARFRRIYDGNVDAIRRYCFRRLPPDEVDDATAEVFVVVWKRINEAPGGDAATMWLYGIARNVVRNQQRSGRRRFRLRSKIDGLPQRHEPDAEMQVIRRIEDHAILDAIAGLRPVDREVLRLAAWEGLRPAQIATVLDIDAHAASMRLTRARNRLAKSIGMPELHGVVTPIAPVVAEGGDA